MTTPPAGPVRPAASLTASPVTRSGSPPALGPRGSPSLLALSVLFVGGAAVALGTFIADPRSIRPTCAFLDGASYCAAAAGERVPFPYNQRPVAPALAGALPFSVGTSFRIVSVASLVIAVLVAIVLAHRIAERLGVGRRDRVAIAAVIGGASVAVPHGLRMAWSLPTMVDEAGLALGLVWAALYTDRRRRIAWLSVPAAFLAGGAREVWGPIIVVVALLSLLARRDRVLLGANAVAGAVVFVVTTALLPSSDRVRGYSFAGIVQFGWHQNLGDPTALHQTAWSFAFAIGLLPLALALQPPLRWLYAELRAGDVTGATVIGSGILLFGLALSSGSDVTRYLYPAGAVLLVFAVPWIVAHPSLHLAAVPLGLATLIIWDPLHHLIATEAEYLTFYYGRAPTYDFSAPLYPKVTWGVLLAGTALLLAAGAAYANRRRPLPAPPAAESDRPSPATARATRRLGHRSQPRRAVG